MGETPVCKSCKRRAINRGEATESDFETIEQSQYNKGKKCTNDYETASYVWT